MSSLEVIFDEYISIIRSYGCDNIVKCNIEPRTWLSYKYFGMNYSEGLTEAENAMRGYFDGENAEKKQIPFGYPRAVEVRPSGGPACESTLVFSAPLPNKGAEAPRPTNSMLYLNEWPLLTVYARPFLGPNTEVAFRQESFAFADELTSVGLKFKEDPYYWIVLTPPDANPFWTHIWYIVKE